MDSSRRASPSARRLEQTTEDSFSILDNPMLRRGAGPPAALEEGGPPSPGLLRRSPPPFLVGRVMDQQDGGGGLPGASPPRPPPRFAATELHWLYRTVLLIFMLLTPISILYFYTLADHDADNLASQSETLQRWNNQHFYVYMTLPLSLFGCALVTVSQPKQNGAFFAASIVAGLTTSYGSAILELIGNNRAQHNILPINLYPYFMMFVVFPPLWLCLWYVRRKVKELQPDELSAFLIDSIFIQGAMEAIPIIILGTRSFNCLRKSEHSPIFCERLVLGNMFPSGYLAVFSAVRLFSYAIPPTVLAKHTFSLRRVATRDISRKQFVECLCYILTLLCVIYSAAQVNFTEASRGQIASLWLVGILGFVSILFVVAWKGIAVVKDMRRLKQGHSIASNADPPTIISEIKWEFLSLLFILPIPLSCFMFALTTDEIYVILLKVNLPATIVVFSYSLFFRPRNKAPFYKAFLYFNFNLISSIPLTFLAIGNYRKGNLWLVGIAVVLEIVWAVLFKIGLAFRDSVADPLLFNDDELSLYLENSVLRPLLRSLPPLIFFAMTSMQCLVHSIDQYDKCYRLVSSRMWLSSYLAGYLITKLIFNSVSANLKKASLFPFAKIATLELGRPRLLVLVLTYLAGYCALYLTLQSDPIEELSNREPYETLGRLRVDHVGKAGSSLIALAFAVEVHIMLGHQERQHKSSRAVAPGVSGGNQSTSSAIQRQSLDGRSLTNSDEVEPPSSQQRSNVIAQSQLAQRPLTHTSSNLDLSVELFDSIAPHFTVLAALFTMTGPMFSVAYAVTKDPMWFHSMSVVTPSAVLWVVNIQLMHPLSKNKCYLRFLRFHFWCFVACLEVGISIGSFYQSGFHITGWRTVTIVLARTLVLWCPCWKMISIGRANVAKLSRTDLSHFLSTTILFKGTVLIVPLLYLAAIQATCMQNMLQAEEACIGTSSCQIFLSAFLATGYFYALIRSSLGNEEVAMDDFTTHDIFSLKMCVRKKIQLACFVLVKICGVYLFSSITSDTYQQTNFNDVFIVGSVGSGCCYIILLSEGLAFYSDPRTFGRCSFLFSWVYNYGGADRKSSERVSVASFSADGSFDGIVLNS